MPAVLLDIDLMSGSFLAGSFVLGAIVLVVLILGSAGKKAPWRRWIARLTVLAAAGLALGWIVTWVLSDVWDVFGVSLSFPTRAWTSVALAALGVAIGNLWTTRWWAKLVAIVAIPILVTVGAVGINADIGEYRTFGELFGGARITPLVIPSSTLGTPADGQGAAQESPTSTVPSAGRWGAVTIPGVVSHFAARPAIVYLPPAALISAPPDLPVVMVLSGQPGQPSDMVTKAGIVDSLDAFARTHHGLAPIVVIPDQLGSANANPMCVDSPLGDSDTYLTVDVPNWITRHLNVKTDRSSWAIAGFSQGGTCAIQLGSQHPEIFGTLVDISGELAPKHGSLSTTIDLGFGGSEAQYEAATPLSIMAANAPYSDMMAVFAVGQDDSRFGPNQIVASQAAHKAGMSVTAFTIPHSAHDWRCATSALQRALQLLSVRFGMDSQ